MLTMHRLASNAATCLLAVALAGSALAQAPAGAPPGPPPGMPAGFPPGGPPPGMPAGFPPGGPPPGMPAGGPPPGAPGNGPPVIGPLPEGAPKAPADPRNLEGTWNHDQMLVFRITTDMYGDPLPYNERGRRLMDKRVKATYVDKLPISNASAECLPPGQPWQMDLNFPFQIYQDKDVISLLFQEYHGAWHIRMRDQHRKGAKREYFGDSIAHWNGDTLVVSTTNYRRSLWLDVDGTPASVNAKLTFRMRKVELGGTKLEVVVTVDDPWYYTKPWSIVRLYAWRPDMANFAEYNCENQVGVKGSAAQYGLVPEPPEETQ